MGTESGPTSSVIENQTHCEKQIQLVLLLELHKV